MQVKKKKDKISEQLDEIQTLLKRKDDHAYRQESKPLSFKEACSYLGYAPSYLYKLTSTSKIPHYKPSGKMLFFSKAELDDWVFGRYGDPSTALGTGVKSERQGARSEEKEIRSKKSEREIRRQKSEIESKRGKNDPSTALEIKINKIKKKKRKR